jgi:hypothetical protein
MNEKKNEKRNPSTLSPGQAVRTPCTFEVPAGVVKLERRLRAGVRSGSLDCDLIRELLRAALALGWQVDRREMNEIDPLVLASLARDRVELVLRQLCGMEFIELLKLAEEHGRQSK